MKVSFVATECHPFIKVGGLGDVIGSLPQAIADQNIEVNVILPFTKDVTVKNLPLTKYKNFATHFRGQKEKITIYQTDTTRQGISTYFLEHPLLEKVPVYYDKTGKYNKADRFLLFSAAVSKLIKSHIIQPDILHLHDYMTGFIPLLLKSMPEPKPKTLFTIHRLASHTFITKNYFKDLKLLEQKSLPTSITEDLKNDGQIDLLYQGIANADILNTVSPTYAREIITKTYGEGIDSIIKKRKKDLYGILNGIDTNEFDPQNDHHIAKKYTQKTVLSGKAYNKKVLVKKLFPSSKADNLPLLGMVSRLDAYQKGLDILYQSLASLMSKEQSFRFVLLGVGDESFETRFAELAHKYPKFVSTNLVFDQSLAHQIFAASDFILIPSKFEPCGLTQMIGMRYGTVPIARKTGGLADTIQNEKTGILFTHYSYKSLSRSIKRAVQIASKKELMKTYVNHVIQQDFSWDQSAKAYVKLYQKMLKA